MKPNSKIRAGAESCSLRRGTYGRNGDQGLDPLNTRQEISALIDDVFEAGGKTSKEVKIQFGAEGDELLLKIGIISGFMGLRAL